MLLHALRVAGDPSLVLNFPSDNGRYWSVLTSHPNRVVLSTDDYLDQHAEPHSGHLVEVAERICVLRTSTMEPASSLSVELGENSVDAIVCMRFLQRIASDEQRVKVLREFHRITRDTLILSLVVDGNYQAWRHRRTKLHPDESASRTVVARERIEEQLHTVGFDILTHLDLMPGYSMWRVYVLRKVA